MFQLPVNGVRVSTNKHNCDYNIIADWIESSLLFSRDLRISKSDIIDILIEENIYVDQDFASEFIESIWNIISFRHKSFNNNNIFEISPKRIERLDKWQNYSAYSFCLAISIKGYYDIDIKTPKNFINIQGEIFEKISLESLKILFPCWKQFHTGWSYINTKNFPQLLADISNTLNVSVYSDAKDYYTKYQKEAKLDILLYRNYEDGFCNIPIYLIQCASGSEWERKRQEPNIVHWMKFINFNSFPTRGLSIPFSLDKSKFIFHSPIINGVLFDRMRILSAYAIKKSFIDNVFKREINRISKIIIDKIPKV